MVVPGPSSSVSQWLRVAFVRSAADARSSRTSALGRHSARSAHAKENKMATRKVRLVVKGLSLWKIALPVRWLVSSVALLGCLLINTTAHAESIGDFNWSEHTRPECAVGLCGPFFFVDNFSTDPVISLGPLGDTFYNVSVGLQTDRGPLSLFLGDIAPGNSSQSIDDLFGTTIATAALTLTFG